MQCIVQQTGLEEAQAAVEQTCTGTAHAAAEEARPEAAEQTLPGASQATNCQVLSCLVCERGTVNFFFSLLNFGFFAVFRLVSV